MSYFDRVQNDGWFAFANVALLGVAGYLLVNKLSKGEEPHQRFIPRVLSKLSSNKGKKVTKEVVVPVKVLVQENRKVKQDLIRDVSEFPIYKIVVTGGPCAGKTTAVEKIKQVFSERGYKVMVVPEIPTMLVRSGAMIKMDRFTTDNKISFQKMLMKAAMHLEDTYTRLASMNKQPGIVICDRGTMDPRAYISGPEFETVLHDQGWSLNNIRDKRYDEVIFMVTAADGAEGFYSLANNEARHQGVERAKELDQKTLNGWIQHPRVNIIPNVAGESFNDKINRVVTVVERIVGFSDKNTVTMRYDVPSIKIPPFFITRVSKVHEVRLVNTNSLKVQYQKAQKIECNGVYSYNRVTKHIGDNNSETRRPITASEYLRLVDRIRDNTQQAQTIDRVTFAYKNQFFTIDSTVSQNKRTNILSVTVDKKDVDRLDIPEFVQNITRLE